MAIYAIGDLHLSYANPKPMDIFGNNWENHEEKIKQDWLIKVKENDTVIHLGDFSWAMHLQDTIKDFEFLKSLPGRKIMLKGNHEYWWTTINKMQTFLKENNVSNVDFLQNNSFDIENKIICGTRGWTLTQENTANSQKMIARESMRLEFSIKDAIVKQQTASEMRNLEARETTYKEDFNRQELDKKEIIVFMHYPPITKQNLNSEFVQILKKYNIKKCYYAHLHGDSINDAVEGNIDGINYKLLSSDAINFKLERIN